MMIANMTNIRAIITTLGFLRYGNALIKHMKESMENSIVQNPHSPIPVPWIFAVVSEIYIRFSA